METNNVISAWDSMTSQQKMSFGEKWISHETDLRAWDKPFSELSPLKRDRILNNENLLSITEGKTNVIGSGINTNTLDTNKFKDGERT